MPDVNAWKEMGFDVTYNGTRSITVKGGTAMNKILYILIFSTLLFSSSDAEQGEVEYVIIPQFDRASPFSEGLALVKIGDKYGYINKEGQYVINPQFNSALSFSEGLAAVGIGGKGGYINREGQLVIKLQFYKVRLFQKDSLL